MARGGRYPLAVGIALLGLAPFVVLSTAQLPVREAMAGDLHTSVATLGLASGRRSAGFAVGAVVAAQLRCVSCSSTVARGCPHLRRPPTLPLVDDGEVGAARPGAAASARRL